MKRLFLLAAALAAGPAQAANDDWCMTKERIPSYTINPTTRVVYPQGPITPARIKNELCAGRDVMNCIMVTYVDRIPGQPLAAGLTERQCGQTPRGRACVSLIAVVRAGATIGGRTLTERCERDTVHHELSHAVTGWRH